MYSCHIYTQPNTVPKLKLMLSDEKRFSPVIPLHLLNGVEGRVMEKVE